MAVRAPVSSSSRALLPRVLFSGCVLAFLLACRLFGLPAAIGDLDEDGRPSSRDIVLLINHLTGVQPLAAELIPFADVNQDGILNDTDADALASAVLGLRPLGELGATTVRSSSPAAGEGDVAVTRETILTFTRPLSAATTITTDRLFAEFGGQRLLARAELSTDRRKVTLFYLEPLPGGSRIRVSLDTAGLLDAYGRAVDGDGDGQPGGVFRMDFDTLSLTTLEGTAVIGRVFASELAAGGSPDQSVNVPLEGVTITLDGREDTVRTVTDTMGNFRLEPVPAGSFFVHIDGRTVGAYDPTQAYYPYVGKKWLAVAGAETSVGNIYLPLVSAGTLQAVSPVADTVVTFPGTVLAEYPELEGVSLTVPANSLFSDSGARGGRVGIAPVPPDRLPGPLPEGLNVPLVITVQTDGPSNFDQPVPICFPNLPNPDTGELLRPGAKTALWSFNHDTGEWEVAGPMTVSADGKKVCTDPGVGILQPGWHTIWDWITGTGGWVRDGGKKEQQVATATADQEGGSDDEDADSDCTDGCGPGGGTESRASQTAGAVLLHSGEERFDRVDLKIPGRSGMDFVLQRRYRSRLDYNGPIGHGWDFNYNEHLYLRPDGEVTRMNGGGRLDAWQPGEGDRFEPGLGQFRSFIREPNGTYVLRSPDGFKRLYRSDGRLYAYVDRYENRMLFDYDADGNLSRVIDVFGREIEFVFEAFPDGIDRLVRVVDFAGRSVSYEYDSRGDLVAVTTPMVSGTSTGNDFPEGRTERYVYAAGQAHPDLDHNLTAVYRPAEVAVGGPPSMQWVYGTDPSDPLTFDRVLSLTEGGVNASGVPAGGTTTYLYEALNDEVPLGDPELPRGRVTVTDPNGNHVENYGNELGQHIMTRVLTRGLRGGEPAYYETRTYHTVDGQLLRKIFPAGNEVRYVYDSGGNRAQQKNLIEIRHVADSTRGGGSDRVTRLSYEPLYSQIATVIDARGNDPGFVPPLGSASPDRYTSRFFYDYQESAGVVPEAERFGIDLSGVARGLGDLNGDGRTDQSSGHLVRNEAPSVTLLPDSFEAVDRGDTVQRVVTEMQWNDRGQLVSTIDAEGNVHRRDYYPENDPDGDGQPTFAVFRPVSAEAYGYRRSEVRDAVEAAQRRATYPPAAIESLFRYSPAGQPLAVRDARGVWTELEWNALNEVVAIVRGANVAEAAAGGELLTGEAPHRYRVQFIYDPNGRLIQKSTENRDSTTTGVGAYVDRFVEYDILDRPVRFTDEIGGGQQRVTQWAYDPNGLLERQILPEGQQIEYAYDERNLMFQVTRGFGTPQASMAQVHYDLNGNRSEEVDAEDHDGDGLPEVSKFFYDGFDQLAGVVDALGNETQFGYDPMGNRVSEVSYGHPPSAPEGAPVLLLEKRYAYDEAMRLIRSDEHLLLASGFTTQRVVDLQDGNADGWVTTLVEYNAMSRRTAVVEDDGEAERLWYDGLGRVRERVDAAGNVRRLEYDANGNTVRVTAVDQPSGVAVEPETYTSVYVYDQLDRLVRSTDNAGQTARFAYDSRDNLVYRSDPEGAPIADPLGLFPSAGQTGLINAPGNTRQWIYDGLGRLVADVVDLRTGGTGAGNLDTANPHNPDGRIRVAYDYDRSTRLVAVRDDGGNETRLGYDALDRLVRQELPDGGEHTFVYDRDDNLRQATDPNGTVAYWTHDGLNRVARVDVDRAAGVGGTTVQTFEYDGLSRLVRSTDDSGGLGSMVAEFVFDSLGRVVEERQNGRPVSSVWSGDGRRLAVTYPGGRALSFAHDAIDRVVAGEDGGGELFASAWIGTGYRELQRWMGNGTMLSHLNPMEDGVVGYDAARRMVHLEHRLPDGTPFIQRDYDYSRAGQRIAESRVDDFGFTDRFTYDSAYRLVATALDAGGLPGGPARELAAIEYGLDGVGNRRERLDTPLIGAPALATYGVNAMSEYTSVGGGARSHSPNGNLIDDGSQLYRFDFRNRLVEIIDRQSSGTLARYAYFADDRRARKIVQDPFTAGVLEDTSFVYDNWQVCEERATTGDALLATYVWGPGGVDDLVGGDRTPAHPLGAGRFYAHQNDRLDAVAVTDDFGNPLEKVVYDDFGRHVILPAVGGTAARSGAGNPYLFQGARLDAESGLYYFRSRYYDPSTGRFLQRDPEWDAVNYANPLNFPGHNPVFYADPFGRSGVCQAVESALETANGLVGLVSGGSSLAGDVSDMSSGGGSGYEPATSVATGAKATTTAVGLASGVQQASQTRAAAKAVAQAERGRQAARAGVRGLAGGTRDSYVDLHRQARNAQANAKNAAQQGYKANVAGGVIDIASAGLSQAETNAKDRNRQDENTTQYFNSLDEIGAAVRKLAKQLQKLRKCGKGGSQEYRDLLDRMEAMVRAANGAGEAFGASESARETHFLADTAENAVTGVLGRLPVVGNAAAEFVKWMSNN